MSTRCFIDFIGENGTLRVYRHGDGYPLQINTATKKAVGVIPDLIRFCEWLYYQPSKNPDIATDFVRWNKEIENYHCSVEIYYDNYRQEDVQYQYEVILNHVPFELSENAWLVHVFDYDDTYLFTVEVDHHGEVVFLGKEMTHD